MLSTIGPETAALTVLRLLLYLACKRYLLSSLYTDLQSISSTTSSPTSPTTETENGVELAILPTPSVHTPKARSFTDTTYLHSTVSRVLFSWTFAECCMLFFLLMLQGVDAMSSETRFFNWTLSLYFLLATILFFIPLSTGLIIAFSSSSSAGRRVRALFTILTVPAFLYLFSYIALPPALSSASLDTAALARLIVLGTIILGLLSGFGAVSSAWGYLPGLSRTRVVASDPEIEAAEYSLLSIRNDLRDRRAELTRREGASKDKSWLSRVGSSFRGGDSLSQEIAGLTALEHQMTINVSSLREARAHEKFRKTFKGRAYACIGVLWAGYCVVRVCTAIYNLTLAPTRSASNSTNNADIIAQLLALPLSHLFPDTKIDVASLARQVSLVLVGMLILASIRRVLGGVTSVLRVASRSMAASFMLLLLAQLMGIYLLSTIVQLRSSFPPPSTGSPKIQAQQGK
ncbi:Abscisic acid G-protein coupled receptor-domain-containing protein [Cyathus striatus]|nr:Abscisic acid G-protein coupled receptor-domain-containing protein [Cyathus striatus]